MLAVVGRPFAGVCDGLPGAEPSVMDDLFIGGLASSQNYRNGVYWCVLRDESLHPNVERLERAIGRNFHKLEIDGFDELMGELAIELKGRTCMRLAGRPQPLSNLRRPSMSRPCRGYR